MIGAAMNADTDRPAVAILRPRLVSVVDPAALYEV